MTSDNVRHELDQIIGATAILSLELELMREVYDAAMAYVRHMCLGDLDATCDIMTKHRALLAAGCKALEEER